MMKITEPSFDESEIASLRDCLNSKWVTQGPMTDRFEKLISVRHEIKHVMACTSCTAALHLATLALQLGPGSEVIVPAFTWVTSAHSAEYVGAKPVFVDIDLSTYNIDPEALEAAITPRTKAIVAVHLFGLAAPMDEINTIARSRGIAVIEDAACAIGTTYRGKPVGGLGDIGCFSFHPRKVVTTGEGGAVTTNRDDFAARVRSQRNHGSSGVPDQSMEPHGPWTMATFDNLGFNLRLSDIQAAVGVAQMAKLDRLLAERRRLGRTYSELLAGNNSIARPLGGDLEGHTYQSYVIRLLQGDRGQRNALMNALADAGIQTRPGTHAVHRLGYYMRKYGLRPEEFPKAAIAEDTTIALPIFPNMTDEDQCRVVDIIRRACA
ncbi:DegT/DnrJ/EryC1/StrS aminotransferase family protein [Bradyrhizobium jicamae]|uniref:DegT/DnrJ/EryC1/StrS family aminotransferase n=1 Tax=Bradyrhizobium jicamae TaxID=280332 RepID=UPI001BAA59EA|nr:DegT/DnrJ/EryC1/StrS family aminotransferase [Bradyrhizobium jicamae]MBR0938034.1 DegT/DnrJ/EryC1/StrS family aminotransferase [Bradyrhizobium jicamae]